MKTRKPGPSLLVSMLVVALAACSGEGHEIYMEAGCDECHGADLKGTPSSGPSLKGVSRHWNEEQMLSYFRDPDSVASLDPRLMDLRDRYGEGMPPLKLADPIAREKLAKYVLR
jgi:mono/diheme cytochrome c family protein